MLGECASGIHIERCHARKQAKCVSPNNFACFQKKSKFHYFMHIFIPKFVSLIINRDVSNLTISVYARVWYTLNSLNSEYKSIFFNILLEEREQLICWLILENYDGKRRCSTN